MRAIIFLLLSIMSISISAQSWRYNNRGKGLTDRDRVRITEENNRRVNRQNYDNYIRQERTNRERQYNNQRTYRTNSEQEQISVSNKISEGPNEKVVSLVVNGTGPTREKAIQNALRNSIEQAFGTFVSTNTEVLNDELVKDEIATVSSGNIKKFEVLSTSYNEQGLYDVSLQTIVSIGNLTNYAKNKGFKVELAGAEFVMNMKMRELNKKNEYTAMMHLQDKLKKMADNGDLFRYELVKGEPRLRGDSKYSIAIKLLIYGNENTKAFYNEIYKTIEALSLSNQEIAEYNKVGLDYYGYDAQLRCSKDIGNIRVLYCLRNYYSSLLHWGCGDVMSWLMPIIIEGALSFVIYDNLGNTIFCSKTTKYITQLNIWNYSNTDNGKGNEVYYYLDCLEGRSDRLLWYSDFGFVKKIPTGFGYATKDIVIGVAIEDYMIKKESNRYRNLLFNPMKVSYERDASDPIAEILRKGRIEKNCYYQLVFGFVYPEEELYKLTTISVENRNKYMGKMGE